MNTKNTNRISGEQKIKKRRFVNDALPDAIAVDAFITISAPAERIFDYWRDVKNLPKFITQIRSVTEKGARLSEWKWKALKGAKEISWDTEITAENKGKHLAWRSQEGAVIAHAGEIVLTPVPHKQATELRLHLDYALPGGTISDFLARVLGEAPATVLQEGLRRFRQLVEVGYLATTEGQPQGNSVAKEELSKEKKEQQ